MTFWRAHISTPHFEFEAYGAVRLAARRALWAGMVQHFREYDPGVDPEKRTREFFAEYGEDINYLKLRLGARFRDRQEDLTKETA